MKKTGYYLVFCMVMLFTSFAMTSCSDDDENVGTSDDLIGTWELTHSEGWSIYEGQKDEWNEDANDTRLKFESNSQFSVYDFYDGEWTKEGEGTWSYKGDKLAIDYGDSSEGGVGTVLELTSSKLVMEIHMEDAGEEVYSKETYRKIKD